jgi:GTPase SAR1 family protein
MAQWIGHFLVVGLTGTGKTTLLVNLSNDLIDAKMPVAVLDPHLEERWDVDYLTDSPSDFLSYAKQTRIPHILIIEEAGETIGRYGGDMNWFATQARHGGHIVLFCAQRTSQVDPTTRNNCRNLIAFEQNPKDAQLLYETFNNRLLLKSADLKIGEFIVFVKGQQAKKLTLF